MEDGANIKMVYENNQEIYFYSHRNGSELPNTLKNALKRGEGYWHDEQCLSRMIFCEMIRDSLFGTTDYGISSYEEYSVHPLLTVNIRNQTVEYDGDIKTFKEFIE